jgi:TRAP-type C4-dicarboxylate transport system permease small subunit
MLDRIERGFERLLRLIAQAGGLVLFALMLLVIFEISQRYFYGRPFRGGYELTELAMALIVAFGLPYTAIVKGHVSVDLFGRWLDRPAWRWITVLVHLAGAAVLALMAWKAWNYAGGSLRMGSLTNMMRIPKYPFQVAVAVSAGLFSMVLLLDAAKVLAAGRRTGGQDSS